VKTAAAWILGALVLVGLVAFGVAHFGGRFGLFRHRGPYSQAELQPRQLTFNSEEDPALIGAISPDGKYLAYTDLDGLHLRLLATGEMQSLPTPKDMCMRCAIISWFPDATRLVISGPVGPQDEDGIYEIGLIGGLMRKLRDKAHWAAVSPDGTQIAFTTEPESALWVMDREGNNARQLVAGEPGHDTGLVMWSPAGKRIAYLDAARSGTLSALSIRSVDLDGKNESTILNGGDRIRWTMWMPDGRIILSLSEDEPRAMEANLWSISVDPATGVGSGSPVRLTDWVGFRMRFFSSTADGKSFVFMNDMEQSDVWVANLEDHDMRVDPAQRMTLSEKMDWTGGWTPDSKNVLFYSDRAGAYDVFSQAIDDTSAQALTTSKENQRAPRMCPSGKCILFMEWSPSTDGLPPATGTLMRMPANGGPSDALLSFKGYYGAGGPGSYLAAVGGFPSFRCATVPNGYCVIAERDQASGLVTFSFFDPNAGNDSNPVPAEKILSVMIKLGQSGSWDLSPDGKRIAYAESSLEPGVIHQLAMIADPSHYVPGTPEPPPPASINVKDINQIVTLAWSADGKHLFVASRTSRGSVLWLVDESGKTRQLAARSWDIQELAPSPDGKKLAISELTTNSNAWMIPKFPN
jgi:eukaryotic-like serine/threonine-protein kinase